MTDKNIKGETRANAIHAPKNLAITRGSGQHCERFAGAEPERIAPDCEPFLFFHSRLSCSRLRRFELSRNFAA